MKRCMVILVAGVLAFAKLGYATIINVPGDQPTIQAGIDVSSDGDIVRVAEGTYVENIDFSGKNIVVGSWFLDAGDPSYVSSTIIDGNQSGSVVSFLNGEDNSAVITGFTIQNGNAERGGGIYCYESSPTISNNTISGNSSAYAAGGIDCNSSSPTIRHNIISGNSDLQFGGGINCQNSNPTINYNTISGNTAYYRGGGIYCYLSSPTITNNTISGNSADWGGGIFCWASGATINYNTISGNTADDWGGGIACYDSSPTITNNTISGNSADWGGGIYCWWYCSPVITNTIFWSDSAPNGPEIYLRYSSSPVITYCDVQGGWAGEGNIDCDPMFCDPENGNFYLDAASCCVGAGEDGVNIGAFGVGCGEEIPTLSEWGMVIMGLLLLALGTVAVVRRRKEAFANEHQRRTDLLSTV